MSLTDAIATDLLDACAPLGVAITRERPRGAPVRPTVHVEAKGEGCAVTLYSGAGTGDNDELASELDGRLVRLLSRSPYRLAAQHRGIAFGNAYRVEWAAAPQ